MPAPANSYAKSPVRPNNDTDGDRFGRPTGASYPRYLAGDTRSADTVGGVRPPGTPRAVASRADPALRRQSLHRHPLGVVDGREPQGRRGRRHLGLLRVDPGVLVTAVVLVLCAWAVYRQGGDEARCSPPGPPTRSPPGAPSTTGRVPGCSATARPPSHRPCTAGTTSADAARAVSAGRDHGVPRLLVPADVRAAGLPGDPRAGAAAAGGGALAADRAGRAARPGGRGPCGVPGRGLRRTATVLVRGAVPAGRAPPGRLPDTCPVLHPSGWRCRTSSPGRPAGAQRHR